MCDARQGHKPQGKMILMQTLKSLYSLLQFQFWNWNLLCRFSTLEECKSTCTVEARTQEALDSGEVCSQSCNSNLVTDNSTNFEQWSFENGQCQWSAFQCSSPANRFESRDVCNAYCNFQRRARTLPAEEVSLSCIYAFCATLFEIFIFCPKIQLWYSEKIVILLGWKTRENVVVLDFLVVDNFDFTGKIVKKFLGEKLVKMLCFLSKLNFWTKIWLFE